MLQEADLIASEDTRNTQKLLNHFDIHTPQKSLHEHNYHERIPQLLNELKQGYSIAQVSDAGMPALIASGLLPQPFLFHGFLGRKKKEQETILEELKRQTATLIFYESPYRISTTLTNMLAILGDRQVVLCRELTKIHEEYLRGSIKELLTYLEAHPVKGECCLLVEGYTGADEPEKEIEYTIKEQVERLIASGEKNNAAIKAIAIKNGLKKQEVYRQFHEPD